MKSRSNIKKVSSNMPTQQELIGAHPLNPDDFERWLSCNDIAPTATKIHRELTPKIPTDDPGLIGWLGKKAFDHHHSDYRIEKLKENYKKLGFNQYAAYAEQNRRLPTEDKTRKGNLTEIILTSYIQSCLGKELTKAFKLKYNPNVDQAMKGDDTLMIDVVNQNGVNNIRIYLGEAKFRATPAPAYVRAIANSLSKDKKPLSYTYLIDELGRSEATRDLADLLDAFVIDEIKNSGDITYTGLLLSDTRTSAVVERSLDSNNPKLVFVSIGIANPQTLIDQTFASAGAFTENPELL